MKLNRPSRSLVAIMAAMSGALCVIAQCYQTTRKICYQSGNAIYYGPPIPCPQLCISETHYINFDVYGRVCYELVRPPSGDPPTGRTNCISRSMEHMGTMTVIRRGCSDLVGCYPASSDIQTCVVTCEDDRLDMNSPECQP